MLQHLRKLSIQLRLTLVYLIIFGTSLVIFGVGTFEYLADSLQHELDAALYNYALDITGSIVMDPEGDLSLSPPQLDKLKIYPFSLGTALIQIRHRNGKIVEQVGHFGALDLPYKQALNHLSKRDDAFYQTLEGIEGLPNKEAESYRVISFAVDTSKKPQLLLQIAVPMSLIENQLRNRKLAFTVGIPALLLIASVLAYWLSKAAIRPIRQIIEKSQEISVTNLSLRLPVPLARDEIQKLSLTLNDMIARLESAFQSQDRFIADASHQLLTPLTILKGELEQGLRNETFTRENIPSLIEEVDRLVRLVQDLLLLARVSAGAETILFEPMQFEDAVMDALSRCDKLAQQKHIAIDFQIQESETESESHSVVGSPELLQHLIFNLVENAVKYSPPSSKITVRLKYSDNDLELTVKDQGPGIPLAHLESIFGRFHRIQQPTTKNKTPSGYGLGLSIAHQIAKLHKGHLFAENSSSSDNESAGAILRYQMKIF